MHTWSPLSRMGSICVVCDGGRLIEPMKLVSHTNITGVGGSTLWAGKSVDIPTRMNFDFWHAFTSTV